MDSKSRVREKNQQNEDVIQIRGYEETDGLAEEREYMWHRPIVACKSRRPPSSWRDRGEPHAAQRSVINKSIWLASKGFTMVRTFGPRFCTTELSA
jgi:hypothetical protein